MKVLTFMVSLDLNYGGPARSVPMLVKGLALEGVDVTLMTIRTKNMNLHALDGVNAKLKILEKGFSANELEEYVLKEKFEIIQLQSLWNIEYHTLAKIAQKHCVPYIVTPRGMLEPWSLSQKKWKKKLALMLYQMKDLQKAACIFTTAEMEAQHVRELGVNVPMSVIPNGIETEGYPCRANNNEVKKQVLFLSRIHEKKGIEFLLEAWKMIHDTYPEWILRIVGNGEEGYINSLKDKVKALELEACVQISDPVFGKVKVQLYQSSSLFCLPSYSENFGMVIAEAMSCGVPVITTTNCPWKILNETNTGWCIDLSVDNLEKTLREVLSKTPVDLYEMGQRASKLVNDNFNYCNVAIRTKELYKWILNGGKEPEFVYV